MSGSALPTILLSASRRADFSELHWFAFAAACQVARPLCRSDQNSSGHRDFYFQASDESVTLLAAGYNYDSHWTVLSMGLSPIGVTTSVAAPYSGHIWTGSCAATDVYKRQCQGRSEIEGKVFVMCWLKTSEQDSQIDRAKGDNL